MSPEKFLREVFMGLTGGLYRQTDRRLYIFYVYKLCRTSSTPLSAHSVYTFYFHVIKTIPLSAQNLISIELWAY